VIVNGRISDTSFSRYFRFRWFFRPILEKVTMFLMQSEEDARRIRDIGANPETVKVTGNMKYDRVPEPVTLPDMVEQWAGSGFLLVAGSTHAGEEEIVLGSVSGLEGKGLLLALVPRHPERFDEVAGLLKEKGIPFSRYTDIMRENKIAGNVLLVDAMGILDGFYALADAAFVGGSLVPIGGHNLLEPAMHGVPVITGPHLHNFRDIAGALMDTGGCILCSDGESLSIEIEKLLVNKDELITVGNAAKMVYEATKGAAQINAGEILAYRDKYPVIE
jgi:3-deoxy-D-manno-octulosonic-acid transferase